MSLGPNRSVRALRRSISSQTPSLGQLEGSQRRQYYEDADSEDRVSHIVGYPSGRPRLEFWNTSNGDYGTIATCITAAKAEQFPLP